MQRRSNVMVLTNKPAGMGVADAVGSSGLVQEHGPIVYALPQERIATQPLADRAASKLMVTTAPLRCRSPCTHAHTDGGLRGGWV